MPSSCGRCGSTPEWAITGRLASACLDGALHRAVEHRLVPRRQLLGDGRLDPPCERACPCPTTCDGSFSIAIGSLCPHQIAIDGWCAEQVDHLAGLAHRLLADAPRVAPLQREVLPQEQPGLVGGRRRARAGSRARARAAGRGRRPSASVDVAGELLGRRLGQRHPRRALVRALEEQALAVDRADPAAQLHLPQPGAQRAPVRTSEPAASASRTSTATSCSGGLAERVRPPQPRARSIVTVHSTWFSPVASGCVAAVVDAADRRADVAPCRRRPRRARPGTARTARSSVGLAAHGAQPAGCGRARSARRATGRHMPPGFQSGSRQSQCWKTPVMLRFARPVRLRRARHLDGEHVLASRRASASVTSKVCGKK